MLRNTFIHVPGIGNDTEQALWRSGCLEWDHLLAEPLRFGYGQADRDKVKRHIERSDKALSERRHQFFAKNLGQKEAWRAFSAFRSECVYLDIETDGGQTWDCVTTIGLYDGANYTCLVKGQDIENFRDVISHYGMIVTFFGASFDLPMLRNRFFGLNFDQIHLDLSPALRRVGVRGGLKKIEKQLGIEREEGVDGLTGYDAVLLWRRFTRLHDDSALEKLVAYNRADVVNLEKLAEWTCEKLKREVFDNACSDLAI